jgi:ADP-heptose:LPS heptosyltransferase
MPSTKSMKLLDHWLGLPLTLVTAVLSRFFGGRRHPIPRPPHHIVVSKYFGLGSIILSLPLLKALRRAYPKAHITMVTFAGHQRFLSRLAIADEFWPVRNDNLWYFIVDTLYNVFRHLVTPIDIYIDLEFYSKYATLFTFLSGAGQKIGFYYPAFWRKSHYSHPIFFNFAKHILDNYGMFASAAGAEIPPGANPSFKALPSSVEKLQEMVSRALGTEGPLVGVNINASDLALGRRWPRNFFIALIWRLVEELNCRILLTGTGEEREYTTECYDILPANLQKRTLNLAGDLSLEEFFAALSIMDLLVTNDSGPVHFAFALGTPTVSIWGPGDPYNYGPRGPRHSQVYLSYPCSPCMYIYRTEVGYFCEKAFTCVQAITVDDVYNQVKKTFSKIKSAPRRQPRSKA